MTPEARRDLIVDAIYAGAITYLVANRITEGALGRWIEERIRHAADWALHMKRIDDTVRQEAPFVVYEAIQAVEEPASE